MMDTWISTDQINKELGARISSEILISVDTAHQVESVLLCWESKVVQCCAPAVSSAEGESLQPQSYFQLQWAEESGEPGQLRADRIDLSPV